jgi:SAM-dependent methyltransferase
MPTHFQPDDLVDWAQRLAGEKPLLERVLSAAPSKRVLDLGCGGGSHARMLANLGYEVLAIDISEPIIEQAHSVPSPEGVEFVVADMGAVERTGRGHFGAAISLGNAMAYLLSPESLSRMLFGLKRRLLPQSPCLFQLYNYDRIVVGKERVLPLKVAPSAEGELVIVRLVEPREDGVVLHTTEVRRAKTETESEMELLDTYSELLQGWRRTEIEDLCEVSRLQIRDVYGDMSESPYDPLESPELVIIAQT